MVQDLEPNTNISPPKPVRWAPSVRRGLTFWFALCGVSIALKKLAVLGDLRLFTPIIVLLATARALEEAPRARRIAAVIAALAIGGLILGGSALWVYPWDPRRVLSESLAALPPLIVASGLVALFLLAPQIRALLFRLTHLNPGSVVHTVSAFIYLTTLLSVAFLWASLPMAPLKGIALDFKHPLVTLLGDGALALPGVGLFITRDFKEALARLGFRALSKRHLIFIVGAATLLFAGVEILEFAGTTLFGFDLFRNRLPSQFVGLPPVVLAPLVSLAAGLGEEGLFRGALQPRFGIVPTALLFAATHIQYELSGVVMVFLIGIAFGIIKECTSTTFVASVHTIYDIEAFFFP